MLALYALDALILGQGFVALGLLLAVLLWFVPKWLLQRRTRGGGAATARLAFSLGLCAVAIMVTINLNNRLAWQRANALVAAIDHYRAVAGHYPRRLEDLVPVYIDTVPRAKYTLSFNEFAFNNTDGEVMLTYADTPPFGRVCYNFADHRWQVGQPRDRRRHNADGPRENGAPH